MSDDKIGKPVLLKLSRCCHDERCADKSGFPESINYSYKVIYAPCAGGMMKRRIAVAALALVGSTLCSTVYGDTPWKYTSRADFAAEKSGERKVGRVEKTAPVATPNLEKYHFLYRDMVHKKHPDAIRNAVIVYGHFLLKRKPCSSREGKDVRECWLGPAA